MVLEWAGVVRVAWRLRAYRPQRVDVQRVWRWLQQHPRPLRGQLLQLAMNVRLVTEVETIRSLCDLNDRVTERLRRDGVDLTKVIYVSLDSAGSSSPLMVNLLKDHSNLGRRGAHFTHSRDVDKIGQLTRELQTGAIIYVDDFSGTGKQFTRSRNHTASYVQGSFSEFFLTVCSCEESVEKIEALGVELCTSCIHTREERALHPAGEVLAEPTKQRLRDLSVAMYQKPAFGFDKLATSVVFYRNAPNSTPLLLRGSLKQHPHFGILPRFDDLPY